MTDNTNRGGFLLPYLYLFWFILLYCVTCSSVYRFPTTIKPCQETSYACMLYSINTKTSQPKIVCQSFGLVNIIISPKLCMTLVQSIYMHYTHISIRDRMAEWSRALTSDMGLFPKEQDGQMVKGFDLWHGFVPYHPPQVIRLPDTYLSPGVSPISSL